MMTDEQIMKALNSLANSINGMAKSIEESLNMVNSRFTTLVKLLVDKDILTLDEIKETYESIEKQRKEESDETKQDHLS